MKSGGRIWGGSWATCSLPVPAVRAQVDPLEAFSKPESAGPLLTDYQTNVSFHATEHVLPCFFFIRSTVVKRKNDLLPSKKL